MLDPSSLETWSKLSHGSTVSKSYFFFSNASLITYFQSFHQLLSAVSKFSAVRLYTFSMAGGSRFGQQAFVFQFVYHNGSVIAKANELIKCNTCFSGYFTRRWIS